ncbi:hypothetical protein B0H13DRAFT_1867889 [Mycena leptocephala]|nr:hypothetical protein B0H13DRAFT_1867889 [Mycena leptocephala]
MFAVLDLTTSGLTNPTLLAASALWPPGKLRLDGGDLIHAWDMVSASHTSPDSVHDATIIKGYILYLFYTRGQQEPAPGYVEPAHWDNMERVPRQGEDNWPGWTATIKAFSIGQKEFVTGQATFQSVPQNPNGGRRLPGYNLNAPRTQTEVVVCQATISIPPEPKKRIAACQATTSMPPGPKRRSQLARPRTRCPQNPNGNRSK